MTGPRMRAAQPPLKASTILLVDANSGSRQVLTSILREHGCGDLQIARDARETVERLDFTANRLALIICAYDLPKVNGLAILKALRMGRTPGARRTPAALLLPSPDPALDLARRAAELDVGFVFGFPIAAQRLCRALADLISAPPLPLRSVAAYMAVPTGPGPAAVTLAAPAPTTARDLAADEARRARDEWLAVSANGPAGMPERGA